MIDPNDNDMDVFDPYEDNDDEEEAVMDEFGNLIDPDEVPTDDDEDTDDDADEDMPFEEVEEESSNDNHDDDPEDSTL
jgi:hypothetical protein